MEKEQRNFGPIYTYTPSVQVPKEVEFLYYGSLDKKDQREAARVVRRAWEEVLNRENNIDRETLTKDDEEFLDFLTFDWLNSRTEHYDEAVLVAYHHGLEKPIATVSTLLTEILDFQLSGPLIDLGWHLLSGNGTGSMHNPKGNGLIGYEVSADPDLEKYEIHDMGKATMMWRMNQAKEKKAGGEIEYAGVLSRPKGYKEFKMMHKWTEGMDIKTFISALEQHVSSGERNGLIPTPIIMHIEAGARPVGYVEKGRPADQSSEGWNVKLRYDVERTNFGFGNFENKARYVAQVASV